MAFIGSELSSYSNDGELLTISDENGAFAGCNEDCAVLAVVNVYIGRDVEDKIAAVFAIVDVVLLLFYRVNFFNLEGVGLVFEAVVVRVILFLDSFWF